MDALSQVAISGNARCARQPCPQNLVKVPVRLTFKVQTWKSSLPHSALTHYLVDEDTPSRTIQVRGEPHIASR